MAIAGPLIASQTPGPLGRPLQAYLGNGKIEFRFNYAAQSRGADSDENASWI
jgi:hypothetical protein